ncbi:hypothetical protein MMPV_000735 [Pyropia vietnamensis]
MACFSLFFLLFVCCAPDAAFSGRPRTAGDGWRSAVGGRRSTGVGGSSAAELAALAAGVKAHAAALQLGPTVITSAAPSDRLAAYEAWIEAGMHGEMGYLARPDRMARRRDLNLILPGVQSVIVTSLVYWPGITGFPPSHRVAPPLPLARRRAREAAAAAAAAAAVAETAAVGAVNGANETRGAAITNTTVAAGRLPSGPAAVPVAQPLTPGPARGIVSAYAWGDDYHTLLSTRLAALATALHAAAGGVGRHYVDTGALLERDLGARGGLGWVGKNAMLIHPRLGSGFFLGELLSTLPLPPDDDVVHDDNVAAGLPPPGGRNRKKKKFRGGCGGCTRCQVACPTGALSTDYVVDARRCVSYLTIELKGAIPEHLRRGIGGRVYGCDVCQVVCPWNGYAWESGSRGGGTAGGKEGTAAVPPHARRLAADAAASGDADASGGSSPLFGAVSAETTSPALVPLLTATDAVFRARYGASAIGRIGRERMARNAAVALGNVGGVGAVGVLDAAAVGDPSALVREHASWGAARIRERHGMVGQGRRGAPAETAGGKDLGANEVAST